MATPTKLESKLAEVLGLAMAAQDAVREVRGMLGGEHQALDKRLVQSRDDAREVERRCKALAGTFKGKKTAILESAKEVKKDTIAMRETYLAGEDDPLDGFEFLTMAEAGEVGHWAILAKLNEKAGIEDLRKLTEWALPIQERHLQEVLDGSLKLAADADPSEEEG
jgi:hypothetical protein